VTDGNNWQTSLSFDEVVKKYGKWTAMSICLGEGQYTIMPPAVDYRLRCYAQIVSDLIPKSFKQIRVLDLGCCEGHHGIEFALQGAEVVAIEIRDANLAKAHFIKERLHLDNFKIHQDDVRNLSKEKYGVFDVVLCAGILYHIDAANVFNFVKNIFEVCGRLTIFDTFVSLSARRAVEFEGKTYYGLDYVEHEKNATEEDKLRDLWSSIDNDSSFWFTQPSLCRLLENIGFTSFYECFFPGWEKHELVDRKTYVAIKGQGVKLLSSPAADQSPPFEIRDNQAVRFSDCQRPRGFLFRFVKERFPRPLKNVIKSILRSLGMIKPDDTPLYLKESLKANKG